MTLPAGGSLSQPGNIPPASSGCKWVTAPIECRKDGEGPDRTHGFHLGRVRADFSRPGWTEPVDPAVPNRSVFRSPLPISQPPRSARPWSSALLLRRQGLSTSAWIWCAFDRTRERVRITPQGERQPLRRFRSYSSGVISSSLPSFSTRTNWSKWKEETDFIFPRKRVGFSAGTFSTAG